jgi:hypothetical protein
LENHYLDKKCTGSKERVGTSHWEVRKTVEPKGWGVKDREVGTGNKVSTDTHFVN